MVLPPYRRLCPWPEKALALTTAIERFANLLARARTYVAAQYGLTMPGWRMLRLVEQMESSANLSELARRLHVRRPSATETAHRLRDAEHVLVEPEPHDRRGRLLVLLKGGEECLEDADAAIEELLLEMTNDIPAADLDSASRMLDRMAARLGSCETVLRRPAAGKLSRCRPRASARSSSS